MQTPIWNIPFYRNSFFTGREDVLHQIHTLLQNTHVTALSQPIAMSGLGGIGKTQTAVEYAYRYKNDYQLIWWIKSSTPEELTEDFASLAQPLKIEEQQAQEQSRFIAAVKQWLETHSHWLLIFDNADDITTVHNYFPQENKGHILITTRAHAMSGMATKIELQIMDIQEGAHLLLQRAGRIEQGTSLEQATPAELNRAYEITRELGGLPLALDQAGAYIEETGVSLSTYLNLYKNERTELLIWRGGRSTNHVPVATTWTLAFQILEESNPSAIELIRLCAFLAPDAIPEDLLIRSAHLLPATLQSLLTNQAHFNQAIAALLKYSLVQRDRTNNTLSIHRLVQAVIKDEISKTQQSQWAEYVVRIVNHVFPFNEIAPWISSQRYLPHALLAAEYSKQKNFTFKDASSLSTKIGIYFQRRGQYKEAEQFLQHSLALDIKLVGPKHPDTAASLNNLATSYREQGRYEEAELLFKQALAIHEERLGPKHPNTAMNLHELAVLYREKEEYEKAEILFKQALAIREERLGPIHPDTKKSLNNLETLYNSQNQNGKAGPLSQ